jgi:hypothetical protein
VPAADASCDSFGKHPTEGCGAVSSGRDALAAALTESTVLERDQHLSCLESNPDLPPGLVRALRIELAPAACGDVLAMPYLEPRRAELERSMEDTLIALATAGRLARLVQRAPELDSPFDKPHFMDFFQRTLKPWIVSQAAAIHDLSAAGARLTPYARGVVAVAAGLADMRFVSVVRQVQLPNEMRDDAEVKEAYYAALDEALEPRKARGRDAALVGLRELGNIGVVFEPRVDEARVLLSQVYAGRRIDALDQLMLPPLPPLVSDTTERKLAALLPTFYAQVLLDQATLDETLLRALLEHGVPQAFVLRLEPGKLDAATTAILARALFERGRRYFRAADFSISARLTAPVPAAPEQALLHALAATLENGPRDESAVLLGGPILPAGTGQVKALDELAAQRTNPSAPLATFDAAYLRSLVPPQNDPTFWDDLGKRYDAAERALHDPSQRKMAHEASRAAKDTAKALRASRAAKLGSTPARDSAK